jgi:glutamate N-acetyltransferase / amino-acid N-acetyltransferase
MRILQNRPICDVPGILASGISCGIKNNGQKDICVIYSKYKAVSAAVFTTNAVKGAPILIDMENITSANTQAIVVNSGNANSCTGEEGILNARKMLEVATQCLNLATQEVLIESTGALGTQLPMDKLIPGIYKACSELSEKGGLDAAEAIWTTDTTIKTLVVEFTLQGKKVLVGGIAKGSTMIHPNMATLFAAVVTSANISKPMLNKAFRSSVEKSFNMISIDGDTSTNDMAVVLANGTAGNDLITNENEDFKLFQEALDILNIELAKMISRDGEGATKLLEVQVVGAKSLEDAKRCAKSVVSSTLIKSAMFGSHPAFPDISCALGYSGANFNPNNFDIVIQGGDKRLEVIRNAININFDNNMAKFILANDRVTVVVDLKTGQESSTAWGCDLTPDYVNANAYLNN